MLLLYLDFVLIDLNENSCDLQQAHGFKNLGKARHAWAIPAVHADVDALMAIHDQILERIAPGDRIVYHGNYTGYGADAVRTIDEILTFRRLVLSMRGMIPQDFVYLRGVQEEMWQKLLQLQFAPDPSNVLLWMLGNGMSTTFQSYGICPHEGIEACRLGIMNLTKWTAHIRARLRAHAGHEIFMNQQQRGAFTQQDTDAPLLFVHAGINVSKPLAEQGDSLWWDGESFGTIQDRYDPFHKVVRGYDPAHRGLHLNCVTATIDDGCGFGGDLVCGGFDAQAGEIVVMLGQ